MRTIFGQTVTAAAVVAIVTNVISLGADSPSKAQEPRLEFRILADQKHDREAAEKAKAADTLENPPSGYRWVRISETIKGANPKLDEKRLTMAGSMWKDNEFAGGTVQLSGINLGGAELMRAFEIVSNTADTLTLRGSAALYFKSISTFQIDLSPNGLGAFQVDNHIIHETGAQAGASRSPSWSSSISRMSLRRT